MKTYKIIILFIVGVLPIFVSAQQVVFRASAQQPVIVGEPFQIVYEINSNGQSFRAPEFNNFEVLAGPFTSSSSAINIVNGQQSISILNTYTLTLLASTVGTFSIPPASIIVADKKVTSNGLSIKVLPPDEKSKQQQQNSGGRANSSAPTISSNDLYIKTIASRTTVFEQEAIVLTYKLYINPSIALVNCVAKKMPDFQGFMKQDIEIPQNRQINYENIDGRNFATVELYKTVLYAQQSGTLRIETAQFEAVLRLENKRNQPRSIFDDIFDDSYVDVNRSITTPAATINVTALPAEKPPSFSGAVGQYALTSSISAQNIKANEAITLTVVITGTGNMKMITPPEIKFPAGFEVYDPKITNDFKTANNGVSGSKTIEYMAIAREQGQYEIPESAFSYFNPANGNYTTLQIPACQLIINKGDGNTTATVGDSDINRQEIKQIGNDIRYINPNNFKLIKEEIPLVGTASAWLMYLIALFVALLLFFILRKTAKENSDSRLVRTKRANKVAVKRLKAAKKLLAANNKEAFYEETLKSVWNYLSDKLNILPSELTKDKVANTLAEKGVDAQTVEQLKNILNTCEFARYAPNADHKEMGNLYEDVIDLTGKIEDTVK
ncbi:MAG: BatD family protein [Prevotellaceae bacterium]|jgi:hypothetical protein|nr:BatD family protein [Prevotellaceae bacterium]